jgi:hypothetical protein
MLKGVIQSKKTFDMCYQKLREPHHHQQNENRTVLCIFNELAKRHIRRPFALTLTWANGRRVCLYLRSLKIQRTVSDFNFVGGDRAFSVSDSTYQKFSWTE